MNILIIGAAGRLGRCLVDQALTADFMVTGLVRTPSSLTRAHDRLTVVQGDLLDLPSLQKAVVGKDAVLVVAAPKAGKFRQKSDLLSKGAINLVAAMKAAKAARLIWVTSAGVDPEYVRRKSFVYKGIIAPLFLENIYADFRLSETVIEEASDRWTIVRPSRLTDGPLTKTYRIQADGVLPNAIRISRADVAHFMLVEARDSQFSFGRALISY